MNREEVYSSIDKLSVQIQATLDYLISLLNSLLLEELLMRRLDDIISLTVSLFFPHWKTFVIIFAWRVIVRKQADLDRQGYI